MAQKSKRARYHAQTKRENSLLRRQMYLLDQERVKSTTLVMFLLGKQGGDVTLDKSYLESVQGQIPFMGYQMKVEDNGDLHIKVVLDEAAMADAMAAVVEAQRQNAENPPDSPVSTPPIVLTDGE